MSAAALPPDDLLTETEIEAAKETARNLIRAGVPLFLARPDPTVESGYKPPEKWETSRPLLDVVDRWRPGYALCAVGGHTCDFVDVDPRNGGDIDEAGLRAAGMWPTSYGRATTPSGGTHDIIAPLRIGKGKITAGIDLQGGLPKPDGDGKTHRGFVFIAPTVRVSKVDQAHRAYRWIIEPAMDVLAEDTDTDDTGQAIGEMVKQYGTKPPRLGAETRDPTTPPPNPTGLLRAQVTTFEQLTTEGNNRTQELDNLALLAGHGVPTYWTAEAARARLLEAALANGYIRSHGQRAALTQINSGLADGAQQPWAPPDPGERAYQLEVAHELRKLRIREEAKRLFTIETETPPEPETSRLVLGGAFIHDAPQHVPAIWGRGEEVLWSLGEPLLLTGPTGVGKTTLGGQIIAGRLGLLPNVLGYPVAPGKRVLYLAMDRPVQIARALGRLLRQYPRDILDERIVFWRGPPPADLAAHPHVLLDLAQQADADTVVLDSLKDAAVKLSDEEVGQGLNRAMQLCVANGIEVLGYHHQTKRGAGGDSKPNSLADVYGSAWITAGVGSVLLLWGNAGDPVVELSHLKQPAGEVGPLQLTNNMTAGTMAILEGSDVLDLLLRSPLTAVEVATSLYGAVTPTKAQVEKARRKILKLCAKGLVVQIGTSSTGGAVDGRKGGGDGARYGAAAHTEPVQDRSTLSHETAPEDPSSQVDRVTTPDTPDRCTESFHDAVTSFHETDVSAGRSPHASFHDFTDARSSTPTTPPLGGGGGKRGDQDSGDTATQPEVSADLNPGEDTWLHAHLTTQPQTIKQLIRELEVPYTTIETALVRLEDKNLATCHHHLDKDDGWSLPPRKEHQMTPPTHPRTPA